MRCWGCIPFPWHPHWVPAGKSRHTHISFDTHTVSHWYKGPSLRLNVPRWVCGMHTCVTCIHAASSHCVQIITNGAHAVDPQTSPTLPVTCLSQSRMFHSMGKKKKKKCAVYLDKKRTLNVSKLLYEVQSFWSLCRIKWPLTVWRPLKRYLVLTPVIKLMKRLVLLSKCTFLEQ